MDAKIKELLMKQTCPAELHADLMEIMHGTDSVYILARNAFDYGRIAGKQEERKRWKERLRRIFEELQQESLIPFTLADDVHRITKDCKCQWNMVMAVYMLGWRDAKAHTCTDLKSRYVSGNGGTEHGNDV